MEKRLYLEPEMEIVKLESEGYLIDTSMGDGINDDSSANEGGSGSGDDFDW